jgi:hypothetical protein
VTLKTRFGFDDAKSGLQSLRNRCDERQPDEPAMVDEVSMNVVLV